jgi:hypothetical protein
MRKILSLALVLGGLTSALLGCSDDSDENSSGASGAAGSGGGAAGNPGDDGKEDQVYPEAAGPALGEMKAGWNEIQPGGETACSKGSPFRFFVRPGASDKVVVEFSGGGACWNDATCPLAAAASVFTETVETPDYVGDEAKAKGINDHSRADNPVKDWTHVFIGYCTGDIHTGNNTRTYTDPNSKEQVTINHKGAANARAVLSWVFKNFQDPQQVLVTGCSAGGYGATFWAPHVKRRYKQSKIYHFSDAAAGVVSPSFFAEINESWKPQGVYPSYIPGSDPSVKANLSSFYNAVGAFFPDMPMAQYNTLKDGTQALYFNFVTGQDAGAWSKLMLGEMDAIRASSKNFSSYVAPGDTHCAIPNDGFYKAAAGDKTLAAWLGEILQDKKPENIACPECK